MKNVLQLCINVLMAVLSTWLFFFGMICIDGIKDNASYEYVVMGRIIMIMVGLGVIIWEIFSYKKNKNKINYFIFSVGPFILTIIALLCANYIYLNSL